MKGLCFILFLFAVVTWGLTYTWFFMYHFIRRYRDALVVILQSFFLIFLMGIYILFVATMINIICEHTIFWHPSVLHLEGCMRRLLDPDQTTCMCSIRTIIRNMI